MGEPGRRELRRGGVAGVADVSLKPICGDAGERLARRIERGTV